MRCTRKRVWVPLVQRSLNGRLPNVCGPTTRYSQGTATDPSQNGPHDQPLLIKMSVELLLQNNRVRQLER
jgi:hypothetical protein